MDHCGRALMNVIEDVYAKYPRVTGLVLGIALHPILTTLVTGR